MKHLCHKISMDSRLFFWCFTSSSFLLSNLFFRNTRIDIIWNFSKCFRLFVVSFISLFHNFILVLSSSFLSICSAYTRTHTITNTHACTHIYLSCLSHPSLFSINNKNKSINNSIGSTSSSSLNGSEKKLSRISKYCHPMKMEQHKLIFSNSYRVFIV